MVTEGLNTFTTSIFMDDVDVTIRYWWEAADDPRDRPYISDVEVTTVLGHTNADLCASVEEYLGRDALRNLAYIHLIP